MITPLIMLAASTLHCTAVVGGSPVRHNLTFPAGGQMVDTMLTRLGSVRQRYAITDSDRSGFNAMTRLAPDAVGVIAIDYSGSFTQIVRVNGTVRMVAGVCR